MMDISTWCKRWNIPVEALGELFSSQPTAIGLSKGSEAAVSNHLRLQASKAGMIVWRNNVGATKDEHGRLIRFGLANDSPALNKQIKSSDLIGIKPGGQFVAIEAKRSDWKYTGTEREEAQLRFISLVNSMGGQAYFSTGGLLP